MNNLSYKLASPEESLRNINNDKMSTTLNWFQYHRFALVTRFLGDTSKEQKLLDFGCGNGLFLQYLLAHNYNLSLYGYDPYNASVTKSDALQVNCSFKKSLKNLSNQKFDFITALDVIEHIQDDQSSLQQIYQLLKPEGQLLLTVPAYESLYSVGDAAYGHYRRYNKHTIQTLLSKTGFSVSYITYFFSFLIPLAIARKYYLSLRQIWRKDCHINISIETWKIFSTMSKIEQLIMQKIKSLPCGIAMFVAAHKTEE